MGYSPTIRSIKNNYTRINKLIFDSCLPQSDQITFLIKNMKDEEGCWGLCQYYMESKQFVLTLTTTFESKSQYLNILIHEMVHMTQYLTDNSMNHSKESFMSWREKLRHYGFELKKEY